MGGFRMSEDSGPVSEINITPLVDVMLVLLIIFMVATPMMESGIPLQLPKASAKALPKDEMPVVLSISKDTRIYLGKEEVDASRLAQRLQTFFKNNSKKEIFIRADQSLPYGVVAQTMATIKSAGIHRIGLVTLPPEGAKKN